MTLPNNKTEHDNHYLTLQNQGGFYISTSCIFDNQVGANIIINDYESFIQKVAYRILSP